MPEPQPAVVLHSLSLPAAVLHCLHHGFSAGLGAGQGTRPADIISCSGSPRSSDVVGPTSCVVDDIGDRQQPLIILTTRTQTAGEANPIEVPRRRARPSRLFRRSTFQALPSFKAEHDIGKNWTLNPTSPKITKPPTRISTISGPLPRRQLQSARRT